MKNKLIILLMLCFLLTGCYNYRELNDLAIISAIGVEKKNNIYNLTIQVLDTEKESAEDDSPKFVIYKTEGKSIQEALRNILDESSKRLFINHMQVLLIDENLAKEGIHDMLDFFFRDPESRKQYNVFIAKDNVLDILSTETLLEKINGRSIKERTRTNAKHLDNVRNITFEQMINYYINPNKEMLISSIKLVEENIEEDSDNTEDTPKKRIFLSDSAVFKNDKLIGYINKEDVIYYNIITGDIKDTILTYTKDNKNITIEFITSKVKIETSKNNINIKIDINSSLNDINYNIDLSKEKNIKEIQSFFENELNKNIKESIAKVIKTYNSDIYGFKDMIYKNEPDYFKNNDISLEDLTFNVESKINISYKGNGVDHINEKN